MPRASSRGSCARVSPSGCRAAHPLADLLWPRGTAGFIKLIRTKSHKKGKSHITKDHYIVDRARDEELAVYFNRNHHTLEDRLYQLPALLSPGGPVRSRRLLHAKRGLQLTI
jgi:hypothetical protein